MATSPGSAGDPDLAREVVAFTRQATRRYNRARSSFPDVLANLYSAALALGCAAAIAVSFVFALRDGIAGSMVHSSLVDSRWHVLPAATLWFLLTYAGLAAIAIVARKLGPVTAGPAEAAWWLPLPLDRRPLVLPSFLRRTLATGLAAAVAYLPFSVLTALDRHAAAHLMAAVTFGAVAVTAVAGAAVLQLTPQNPPQYPALMLAALVPGAVLPFLAGARWPLALALAGAAAALAYAAPRAGLVPRAELVRGGAVSGHVHASVFFLEANELHRALAVAPRSPRQRRRGARFFARPVSGAFTALVRADIVAFFRLGPPVAGPLLFLAICGGVVLIDPALPALVQIAVLVIAGCATASGTGTVIRRTALIPELDALVPLPPWQARLSRLAMPTLAMGCWMGVLTAGLAALGPAGPLLVPLGVLAGAGMAAGTLRAATRPAPDWTRPPVETPFGPVPRDQVSALLRGTDMTILAMMPVMLALYLGFVHPLLIPAQLALSAGSILYEVRFGGRPA
ncbi:hypothetical protein CXX84_07035 [Arthrobacter sp. AFG7.2]|uniref:DUF6297 family protein n=1 Tax=Arthrobacter sp. AFG7.2 TaxID=1688693 RepID=UPI000C9EA36E|nr:DUF6297 family protein [Arthrobacter sp. AFG7.2]PNI09341.1 hypothetical protein CXX84_07035 [Arthrobacter sp. AFG7.2]